MGTTVFATKRALRDLLTTLDLDGAQVLYADTGSRRTASVWLGPDVEDVEDEAVGLRPKTNRRQESYLLHVMVEVIQPGTVETVEQRAETIVNAILSALDAAPKLGDPPPVAGLTWAVGEGLSVETTETTDGVRVVVDLSVRVSARP